MRKTSILLILIIVTLLAVTTPVAALSLKVDFGKTYKSHQMNISAINATDIWRLNETQSQILSTVGDNSDLQALHNPPFRYLTRNFNPTTGFFDTVTVTVSGTNPSTVDWTTLPAEKFYIMPEVPTIQQNIPGKTGNPLLTKYNISWNTGSAAGQGLFLASSGMNMYNTSSIMRIDTTDPNDIQYYFVGKFSASDVDANNFTHTLDMNKVPVTSFTSPAAQSRLLGTAHPEAKAGTGTYFISTIQHDEALKTTNVYSVQRVVALKAKTPLTWKNNTGTYTAKEYTYFKGITNQAVVLSFTGTNTDINNIKNVTYLIMNRTASYDITMNVDTNKLAENAQSRWQNSLSSGQVIDLLYKTLNNDNKLPFSYTMKAVGVTTTPSTQYSNIAITPGYGISKNAKAKTITPLSAALESLKPGYYDIYLMGTDINNDVVALDQKMVRVVPTVTAITPASHIRDNIVFSTTVAGNAFASGATVQLINGTTKLTATNVVVASTGKSLTCKFKIPATAKVGVWNVKVTNKDKLYGTKLKAFTVKTVSPPTVTSITPASHKRNNVAFSTTVAGTQFAAGAKVQLTRTGKTPITATSVVVAGTGKSLTCSFKIPASTTLGLWNVKVINQDGQAATKANAFTVLA